jgi:hypothetical protein
VGGVLDSMNGRHTRASTPGCWVFVKLLPIALAMVCPVTSLGCRRARDVQTANPVYDAGVVFADLTPVITHDFEITNRSSRALRIVSQEVSCIRTATELASREIPPQTSTMMQMNVPTPHSHSRQTFWCILRTSAPGLVADRYGIKFESYPRATSTKEFVDFGSLRKPEESGSLLGTSGAGIPPSIVTVEMFSPSESSYGSIDQIDRPPEVEAFPVGTPVLDRLPNGVMRTRADFEVRLVRLKESGNGAYARALTVRRDGGFEASLKITWRVESQIRAVPGQIHFGVLSSSDGPMSARVWLSSPQTARFELSL